MGSLVSKSFKPCFLHHLRNAVPVKYLGRGTFGEVILYKCIEKYNKQTCNKCFVVKKYFMKDKLLTRKNVLNEYTIGTLLHHKNIRETLDIDLDNNSIIFEECNGVDLFTILTNRNRESSFRKHLNYFKQLVDAVEYMHSRGIAHRDIKLENVVIDETLKCVKLIDFGEAFVYKRSLCESGEFMEVKASDVRGTTQYIAPEVFTDLEYDPRKADIWALGIVLYEIVFYTFPWEKACNRDKRYYRYSEYFKNNRSTLYPMLFPDCIENCIMYDLFVAMLDPDPVVRSDISVVKKFFL